MEKNKINSVHIILLCFASIVFVWSAIKPASYLTWVMEVLPAVTGILILLFTYNRFQFTTLSYAIIAILTVFMFIGGHFTYAKVPLFEWLKNHYDLKRNHYDRFGHFSKGFLAIPIRELLIRRTCLKPSKWLVFLTLCVILALSACYEIAEWLAAEILGRAANDFLGAQGDIWDSEWDMALALSGGVLCLLALSVFHNQILRKK